MPIVHFFEFMLSSVFQANVLVSVVRGALGPQLERTIREQLEHEHSVIDGKAERKPVRAHTFHPYKVL